MDSCSSYFVQKIKSRNEHIKLVHEGKKCLNCDICSNIFENMDMLTEHIVPVHEKKKCSICEYVYSFIQEISQRSI